MHKRILPFSMVVCGAMLAYACSSSSSDTPAKTDGGGSSSGTSGSSGDGDSSIPEGDSSTLPDGAKPDGSVTTGNPIEGIAPVTAVPGFNAPDPVAPTDGAQWRTDGLYFSTAVVDGFFVKLAAATNATAVVHGATAGSRPFGNAYDAKNNTFVSCESIPGGGGALIRTSAAGVPTPITMAFAAGGQQAFDSPNDIAVRKADGMIYLTDPGYLGAPTNNRLWRIKPGAGAAALTTADAVATIADGRPNGIALSVDEKTLYVSFTDPAVGAPNIMKYPLTGADGVIGAGALFATVGGTKDTTALDGLAVDSAGNVYAAVKTGVDVFKADGSGKWGHIPAPALALTHGFNGVAFGGADKKTLYMTSEDGMFKVTVKVAGLE